MDKPKNIYKILFFVAIGLIILAAIIFWALPVYNAIQYNNGVRDLIIQQTQNKVCLVTNGTSIIQIPLQ